MLVVGSSIEARTPGCAARCTTRSGRDLVEHTRHRSEICKIDLVECESIMLERLEASALERRIIVRRHCVDADNSFPAREQALTDMHADEAGSAGNHHRR